MPVVTLLSGGLDSAVMAKVIADEGEPQFPLFIDYGQRSAEREWHSACNIAKHLDLQPIERLTIRDFGRLVSSALTNESLHIVDRAYLPGRNTLFLLSAAAYAVDCHCDKVAIGLLSEKHSLFSDQTSSFLRTAETLLSSSVGTSINIIAPMMMLDKASVIRIAHQLGISGTYSCHAGTEVPCGVCIACKEFITKE